MMESWGEGQGSGWVRVKVCFLLYSVEENATIFLNSGLLFCAVFSRTFLQECLLGLMVMEGCKVVVCHTSLGKKRAGDS